MEKFTQREGFDRNNSTGKLKVSKLFSLIDNHPNKDLIYQSFDIENIKDEYILIDYIDSVYNRIYSLMSKYFRYNILAETKSVNLFEQEKVVQGKVTKEIAFEFENYMFGESELTGLRAVSIYDSKNTFLDQYVMTKYANNLFKIELPSLANYNIQYFKSLANQSDEFNKVKSYRLVENNGDVYVRGITSNRYQEYGVDFAFVIGMLILHKNMKDNKGLEYTITSAAVSESKLDIIVTEKQLKDAGTFGNLSTAVKISTNDLGTGSLNFSNVINLEKTGTKGVFLFPKKSKKYEDNSIAISHTTKPEKTFEILKNMESILNTSELFLKDLNEVKTIKTPDELRMKILAKVSNPKSSFKSIKKLSDIFNRKIDNEISNFKKLLEMCNKAEELDIDFDLKDKLRYIISDILLYGNTKI